MWNRVRGLALHCSCYSHSTIFAAWVPEEGPSPLPTPLELSLHRRPGRPENLNESGFSTYPLLFMAMGLVYSMLHADQYQASGLRQMWE